MKTYQDKNHPLYEGLPFQHIRGEYISYPCVAELKADGEFQYVIKKDGKVRLLNKREHGRIREDMPLLVPFDSMPDNSVVLAELVYGAGTNFYDFARHKLSEDLNLVVFGVLRWNGEDIWKDYTYAESRKLLQQQKFYGNNIALTPHVVAYNKVQLDDFYNRVTQQGFEGIVIKDPLSKYINGDTGRWVKRKFNQDNDFVIIGFETGTKKAKTLSVILGHRVDGKIVRLSNVGGGFDNIEKDTLLKVLKANVTRQEGVEYFVEPKIVVTVNHCGVIRNPDGSVSSIRHPVFKRFRYDATPDEIDTIK